MWFWCVRLCVRQYVLQCVGEIACLRRERVTENRLGGNCHPFTGVQPEKHCHTSSPFRAHLRYGQMCSSLMWGTALLTNVQTKPQLEHTRAHTPQVMVSWAAQPNLSPTRRARDLVPRSVAIWMCSSHSTCGNSQEQHCVAFLTNSEQPLTHSTPVATTRVCVRSGTRHLPRSWCESLDQPHGRLRTRHDGPPLFGVNWLSVPPWIHLKRAVHRKSRYVGRE